MFPEFVLLFDLTTSSWTLSEEKSCQTWDSGAYLYRHPPLGSSQRETLLPPRPSTLLLYCILSLCAPAGYAGSGHSSAWVVAQHYYTVGPTVPRISLPCSVPTNA